MEVKIALISCAGIQIQSTPTEPFIFTHFIFFIFLYTTTTSFSIAFIRLFTRSSIHLFSSDREFLTFIPPNSFIYTWAGGWSKFQTLPPVNTQWRKCHRSSKSHGAVGKYMLEVINTNIAVIPFCCLVFLYVGLVCVSALSKTSSTIKVGDNFCVSMAELPTV